MSKRKRIYSNDPTFNAIQELIYRHRAKWSDNPVDDEGRE